LRDVLGIERVGPREHRQPERRGLEQVVPADRHEAPADEGDIARRVEHHQFPERIAEVDLGARHAPLPAGTRCEADALAFERRPHFREAGGMARHEDQQGVRVPRAHESMGIEQEVFFLRVRAARDPHWPARRMLRPQRRAPRLRGLGQREIELDVAHHVRAQRVCADEAEAVGVGGALGRDHDAVRKRFAKQRREAPVAADRARRNACARKHQRHAPPAALVVEIGP